MKVAITVGGGSCPGISALLFHLKALIPGAHFFRGWDGLLRRESHFPQEHRMLEVGGSVIGTSRYKPSDEDLDRIQDILGAEGYDGLIAIGGNDTLSILARFTRFLNVIGVPKTLDNDLAETEVCLGHWSVLENLRTAILRTLDSLQDHGRFLVVETIGQDAGWVALRAAEMVGADLVLIPEFPVTLDAILKATEDKPIGLILCTESVQIEGLDVPEATEHPGDSFGTKLFLGRAVGARLASAIAKAHGHEARCETLRDSIRGGPACAYDVHLAYLLAMAARDYLKRDGGPLEVPQGLAVHGLKIETVPAAKMVERHFVSRTAYRPWEDRLTFRRP